MNAMGSGCASGCDTAQQIPLQKLILRGSLTSPPATTVPQSVADERWAEYQDSIPLPTESEDYPNQPAASRAMLWENLRTGKSTDNVLRVRMAEALRLSKDTDIEAPRGGGRGRDNFPQFVGTGTQPIYWKRTDLGIVQEFLDRPPGQVARVVDIAPSGSGRVRLVVRHALGDRRGREPLHLGRILRNGARGARRCRR